MKTRLNARLAIALAIMSAPILNGCGQGRSPAGVGGPVVPGLGTPVCLNGGTINSGQGIYSPGAALQVPFTITSGQFSRTAMRYTAGRLPQAVYNLAGVQPGTQYGQVTIGGSVPMSGGGAGTYTVVGADRSYGSNVQMSVQNPFGQQVNGGLNPNTDSYGFPITDTQLSASGVLQLTSATVSDMYYVAQMLAGQSTGFIGQQQYFPTTPGVVPVPGATQFQGQQLCVTEVSMSADLVPTAYGQARYRIGDVFVFINNSGHGVRIPMNY